MGEDDHGLSQCDDRQDGDIEENILEIIDGKEGGRPQGDSHHQDQDEEADPRFTKTDQGPQNAMTGIGNLASKWASALLVAVIVILALVVITKKLIEKGSKESKQ